MKRMLLIMCLATYVTCAAASAATTAGMPAGPEPHPFVPTGPTWVKGVLTIILLLFAFAVPVGIIIRANMPEAPPEPHDDHGATAHDDHDHARAAPGGSGHH